MEKKIIYKCPICGNMFGIIEDSGVTPVCCGRPMISLVANTSDGAKEKHVPEVEVKGNEVLVKVGSVVHPMEDAHYIEWIMIETNMGRQRYPLLPPSKPEARFLLKEGETLVAVYEHCNIHGLFKKEL